VVTIAAITVICEMEPNNSRRIVFADLRELINTPCRKLLDALASQR